MSKEKTNDRGYQKYKTYDYLFQKGQIAHEC
jgi:hypothetical protein